MIGMEETRASRRIISAQVRMFGHDARLMPAKYVRRLSKGQKNDFSDAEAIEAVQRPIMKFVRNEGRRPVELQDDRSTVCESDSQPAPGIINQTDALNAGARHSGAARTEFHAGELPGQSWRLRRDVISPPPCCASTWQETGAGWMSGARGLSTRSKAGRHDQASRPADEGPGIGPNNLERDTWPTIGTGDVFSKGSDFGPGLGLVPKQISTGDRDPRFFFPSSPPAPPPPPLPPPPPTQIPPHPSHMRHSSPQAPPPTRGAAIVCAFTDFTAHVCSERGCRCCVRLKQCGAPMASNLD